MTENRSRYCVIIPVYRHFNPLVRVLNQLDKYSLSCFLIDDGNEIPLKDALTKELARRPLIEVLQLSTHSGKGVACVEGARMAQKKGFTHAIFMDADDQHEVEDIPKVLELSRQHPAAMILGKPVFDPSAPFGRRFGRIVSNMWVWIETLSLDIKDSLCGFRCLPLDPFVKIAARVQIGQRMDFEPDIVVRMFWQGVTVINFETRIRYPSSGISNFHMLGDNAALFRLHTRLFFGMVVRTPQLLSRHWTQSS